MPTLEPARKDQVTVEAETVEDALAEISTTLGEDAEIMRAQKVHRGGVGGFFAKEMVQLTARRRRKSVPLRQAPAVARDKSSGGGIADVLERMAQDADAEDGDFRTALRRELAAQPTDLDSGRFLDTAGWESDDSEKELATPAAPVVDVAEAETAAPALAAAEDLDLPEPVAVGPVVAAEVAEPQPEITEPRPEPAPAADLLQTIEVTEIADPVTPITVASEPEVDQAGVAKVAANAAESANKDQLGANTTDAPLGMGPVDWSTTALLRLGMPGPVVAAGTDVDPDDDLAWIDAIASVVAPHCGRLPTGDVIVVGPHAERLAEPLGLPLVHAGEMAPYDGSFCAMVEDSTRDREWLEYVQGGRGIHLVIGDEPWQDLLIGEPVAVSWVGETAIADALYLAFTLGATLGYGTVDGFVSTMVRAQPTDVALAVRRIVGRR